MTANPSFPERARRLPRDFAWITVVIHAALFLVNMTVQLLPSSPHSERLREVYAMPGVWIPMVSRVAMVWLLAAVLAWSHARSALDRQGTADLAGLPGPRSRFAAVYLAVVVLNAYALTPLLYQLQLLFMPGGWLQEYFNLYTMRSRMASTMLIQSVVQLIVVVLSVWLAAWFALRKRTPAPRDTEGASADSPPRRAVAWVGAAVFVSLQMWAGSIASGWVDMARANGVAALVCGWIVMPLLVFALAFWGGWLGAPQPAQARPFRAAAAAVIAFVLLQVVCIAMAAGWLVWVAGAYGLHGEGGLIAHVLALAAIYLVLLVVLMRAATQWLYRRYL
jgi:hypothetical protein